MTDDADRYSSAAALRQAHTELLRRHRQEGDAPATLDEIEAFLRKARATGALIDADEDRWACQSLLDYWTATLYRSGRRPPDNVLEAFDESLAPELDDRDAPYVGLSAFDERTRRLFFGRDRVVDDLLQRVRAHPLTVVIGPSGSGKSSVVLAGLVPALKSGSSAGSEPWRVVTLLPGTDPLTSLAVALSGAGAAPATRERLARDSDALRQILAESQAPVLLVVDQFEEVFTLAADERARQAFVANLTRAAGQAGTRHRLVITMRSDFENQVALLPEFQPLFEHAQFRVTPLSAHELRQAIEEPAALVGLKFDKGVVELLVKEILGEPAGLPLLQFTLSQLWEHRQRNRVTMQSYQRVGGGRMALARSADQFYAGLLPEEQVTARRILLTMVRPGEGLEVTSNPVTRKTLLAGGEAPDRVERVLDKLIAARLVKVRPGASDEDHGVEVAHEALVRNWPTLVGWIEDERANLRRRVRLRAAAEQWVAHGRDPGGLLGGSLLEEARQYDDLAPLEREFVAASQAAADAFEREKDAARQRELTAAQALAHEQRRRAETEAASARRLRWLALGLAAVSLVAVVLAASAFLSLRKAERANVRAREQAALAEKSRKQAEDALAKLQVENKRLEVARDQAQQYRESLTTLSNRIGSYGNPEWTKAAVAVEPLTARLRVRASAVPRRGVRTSTGDQTYDFALWIDGPDAALDRVKSVTYEFNHPTFRQKVQQSSDRAAKFRVGYVGWGCLASVIVTLEPVDAGREKSASIDFNMCGALGGDARS